jgi:hypothetical protein
MKRNQATASPGRRRSQDQSIVPQPHAAGGCGFGLCLQRRFQPPYPTVSSLSSTWSASFQALAFSREFEAISGKIAIFDNVGAHEWLYEHSDLPLHFLLQHQPPLHVVSQICRTLNNSDNNNSSKSNSNLSRQAKPPPAESIPDAFGRTPLHVAVAHGCTVSVLARIMNGDAKRNPASTSDQQGRLALHWAMYAGRREDDEVLLQTVAFLVEAYPLAVDRADASGRTPLELVRATNSRDEAAAQALEAILLDAMERYCCLYVKPFLAKWTVPLEVIGDDDCHSVDMSSIGGVASMCAARPRHNRISVSMLNSRKVTEDEVDEEEAEYEVQEVLEVATSEEDSDTTSEDDCGSEGDEVSVVNDTERSVASSQATDCIDFTAEKEEKGGFDDRSSDLGGTRNVPTDIKTELCTQSEIRSDDLPAVPEDIMNVPAEISSELCTPSGIRTDDFQDVVEDSLSTPRVMIKTGLCTPSEISVDDLPALVEDGMGVPMKINTELNTPSEIIADNLPALVKDGMGVPMEVKTELNTPSETNSSDNFPEVMEDSMTVPMEIETELNKVEYYKWLISSRRGNTQPRGRRARDDNQYQTKVLDGPVKEDRRHTESKSTLFWGDNRNAYGTDCTEEETSTSGSSENTGEYNTGADEDGRNLVIPLSSCDQYSKSPQIFTVGYNVLYFI